MYIHLPNGRAQVEQLNAMAGTDVCGVATLWTWQMRWKWKCTRSGQGAATNRRNWSPTWKKISWIIDVVIPTWWWSYRHSNQWRTDRTEMRNISQGIQMSFSVGTLVWVPLTTTVRSIFDRCRHFTFSPVISGSMGLLSHCFLKNRGVTWQLPR